MNGVEILLIIIVFILAYIGTKVKNTEEKVQEISEKIEEHFPFQEEPDL